LIEFKLLLLYTIKTFIILLICHYFTILLLSQISYSLNRDVKSLSFSSNIFAFDLIIWLDFCLFFYMNTSLLSFIIDKLEAFFFLNLERFLFGTSTTSTQLLARVSMSSNIYSFIYLLNTHACLL
jgi:hypothetical protein